MKNVYYQLCSGNENTPAVIAPDAVCVGRNNGCLWQSNFNAIDSIKIRGCTNIPFFRSHHGYFVLREDLLALFPKRSLVRSCWVGDVVFIDTFTKEQTELKTRNKYYFLKAKRQSKVICRSKNGRIGFCKFCKLPSPVAYSNIHLLQKDVVDNKPFFFAEKLRFLVHPDIAKEIFKAKLKRISVEPIPVLPEPIDGLPADLFKLTRDYWDGKANLVHAEEGFLVADKEKAKPVTKRRKSDVKKANAAINQLKKCLTLKSPAFELVYAKKSKQDNHDDERMYAAIRHKAPTARNRKTRRFNDDFRKYHLAFSLMYENYSRLSLYQAEMDSRGVIEIAAFDKIRSLANEFKKAATEDYMFSEVEELFDSSYVFAESESSYFLYCIDGHKAGHVVMVTPSDRWSENTVATSFEDFLNDLSNDPIGFCSFCKIELEYVAGRETFEAVAVIEDSRKL